MVTSKLKDEEPLNSIDVRICEKSYFFKSVSVSLDEFFVPSNMLECFFCFPAESKMEAGVRTSV